MAGGKSTLNLEPVQMYTIFCVVHGGNPASSRLFSVEIDENKPVDALKDCIIQKKPKSFKDVEADELILYKIDAYGDTTKTRKKTLQEEILRVDKLRKFSDDAALDICKTMHHVFPNGPPTDTYHILVVLQGEPLMCVWCVMPSLWVLGPPANTWAVWAANLSSRAIALLY